MNCSETNHVRNHDRCYCGLLHFTSAGSQLIISFLELPERIVKTRPLQEGDEVICTRMPSNCDRPNLVSKMTVGRVYKVVEVREFENPCGGSELREIKVANDIGQIKGYSPRNFETVDKRIYFKKRFDEQPIVIEPEHGSFLEELGAL